LQGAVDDWKAGTITDAELQAAIKQKGDDIQERARVWIELAIGAAALIGIPGTAAGVNYMRNRDLFTKGVRVPADSHIEVPVTPQGLTLTGVVPTQVVGATATVEAGNAVKTA